ncbi:protein transporter tim10 [Scheffersomyces spartinae]|uniref:Mitochondrial import inner membrane translocase subunit n=1 Tax=Scheffersomyces spartinae TaxID=45513 RepID=A0A9P7V717_9ASCO|nr:protein transporter tim10 [Scheffersomyces spartinae]KAG7192362.1 protein transporter tim10 [Scheffersomyces spartinae]
MIVVEEDLIITRINTLRIMFGIGGSAPQVSSQQKLAAAEAELDMVTDMFNTLVDKCHQKCIVKPYGDSDLTKQESLCLDRCVSKYFETNVKVGEHMQKLGQSNAFLGRQ